MVVTIQDALAAGCCLKGVEAFSEGAESMTVENVLKRSRRRDRLFALVVVLCKLGTRSIIRFHEYCLDGNEVYFTPVRQRPHPNSSPCAKAVWVAEDAIAIAVCGPYMEDRCAELDRQDAWLIAESERKENEP